MGGQAVFCAFHATPPRACLCSSLPRAIFSSRLSHRTASSHNARAACSSGKRAAAISYHMASVVVEVEEADRAGYKLPHRTHYLCCRSGAISEEVRKSLKRHIIIALMHKTPHSCYRRTFALYAAALSLLAAWASSCGGDGSGGLFSFALAWSTWAGRTARTGVALPLAYYLTALPSARRWRIDARARCCAPLRVAWWYAHTFTCDRAARRRTRTARCGGRNGILL